MPEDRFKDMASVFGPPLPFNLRGLAVYADPPDACDSLTKPPNVENPDRWIVVIGRYNCSFEHKIRMAQNASYDAVIIHNVNSSELGNLIWCFKYEYYLSYHVFVKMSYLQFFF